MRLADAKFSFHIEFHHLMIVTLHSLVTIFPARFTFMYLVCLCNFQSNRVNITKLQTLQVLTKTMAGLQVIGAGLGRTGTLSMKLALEELGFNPCHHMDEVIGVHTDRNHLFKTIYEEEDNIDAIKELFGGFVASVDYPGCMFYEEFMKINPDAKVILTIRDTPEAWAKSAGETIMRFNNQHSSVWAQEESYDIF